MRSRIAVFCIGILLTMLILSVFCSLLINSRSYADFIFKRIAFVETEESLAVHDAIQDYLNIGTPLSSNLFTEREIHHMRDVWSLVQLLRRGTAVLCGTLCIIVVFLAPTCKEWALYVQRALFFISSCVVIVGGMCYFFFDSLFITFHRILFTNDLWLLDPAQHALIRAYPPEFFFTFCLYAAFGLLSVSSIGLFFLRRRII